jgi:uncharacterized protein
MRVGDTGYAFNRTRHKYLAAKMCLARTHWSRLRGLMFRDAANFCSSNGLWIHPSHGIHTFAMRFPIDVVYLNRERRVVHLEFALRPWRVAPVLIKAESVLELPAETLRATGTAIGDEIEIGVGQHSPAVLA